MEPAPASTLFFALPAPDPVRALAGRIQDEVRRRLGPARFPALEGLHVTLAFLGPTGPDRVPDLLGTAAEAGGGGGFTLRTAGVGGFPRPARSRILWLGFEPQPALDALADRVRRALRAAGASFDPKPFTAHLTLARFREPVDLGRVALAAPEAVAFPVQGFSLFRSVPTPQGTRYLPLGTVAL
jgi:2'-5' RNA ligase